MGAEIPYLHTYGYLLLKIIYINLIRITTPILPFLLKWFTYKALRMGVEKNRTPMLLPCSHKRLALCKQFPDKDSNRKGRGGLEKHNQPC